MTQRFVNYTYGTGNPVLPDGSIDVRDGVDNLQSFDIFMNADEDTYNQRDGEIVKTLAGAVRDIGIPIVGNFTDGCTVTQSNQGVQEIGGSVYRWAGVIPKTVPAGSSPATTGGIGPAGWVDVGDASLRTDLASPYGVFLVGGTQVSRLTTAQARSKSSYNENEIVYVTDVGYNFCFKSSRQLISGYPDTEVTVDDTLHILVTSGGMLQFCDWGIVRAKQADNKASFAGKLKSTTAAISIDCYGDSIPFGQAQPSSPNSTNRTGQPTNFGDGSVYGHWQFNVPYPQWIASFLADNISQSSSVSNRGYSGDRAISGYLRHRVVTGADACTVAYGINDQLFASSNGTIPDGINSGEYSLENYAVAMRLFVAKQIVQGKCVVVVAPTPFASSVVGFDGTKFSASKLTRAYSAAAKAVADEFGCQYIDACQDIFNQYSMIEVADDGAHLNPAGLKIMGTRTAAALLLVETENRVSHGSVLVANPNINAVLTKINGNVLPNSTSVTPRGDITDQKTAMLGGSDWITIPFYAESDGLVAYVNGLVGGSASTIEIRLDDGALQSDYHYQYEKLSGKPASTKSRSAFLNFNRETENISLANDLVITVANRGWHSISINKSSGSGTLLFDSIYFEALPSVLASDVYGCTAKAVWTSGGFDSAESLDISSFNVLSTGVMEVLFKNQRVDDKYQVIVDIESPNIGNMFGISKTPTGFTVSILSSSGAGAGMSFNPLTPLNAVFTVLGGR